MKKILFTLMSATVLFAVACKKDKSTTPVTPVTPTNPYYFKFNINGGNFNLTANLPQYRSFYTNELGGYQVDNNTFFPSAGLSFLWPSGDTVKEADVLGLKGRTLHFNDLDIHPQVTYDEVNVSLPTWYSNDTANTSYFVTVTNVKYLKNDTTLGNPLRTYVITGTCSAVMSQGDSTSVMSGGEFNFIVSRRDL